MGVVMSRFALRVFILMDDPTIEEVIVKVVRREETDSIAPAVNVDVVTVPLFSTFTLDNCVVEIRVTTAFVKPKLVNVAVSAIRVLVLMELPTSDE